jgi:probable H4MPT-linked C1 transfer pathway protein
MASVIGKWCKQCVLIDVGSTTTDIIPIADGVPATTGQTDVTRMANSELLYTGATRTNVATIVNEVVFDCKTISVASELFATIKDVYVVLGKQSEDPDDHDNADDGPSTKSRAMHRLARTLCSDIGEIGEPAIIDIAKQIADAHESKIANGITIVLKTHSTDSAVVAGSGAWLAKSVLNRNEQIRNVIAVNELIADHPFADQLTSVGPAWAVKYLAEAQQQRENSGLSN